MKKLRIDILSILIFALLMMVGIVVLGERVGIETPKAQGFWLSGVALCGLLLAVIASLDRVGRWSASVHSLVKRMSQRQSEMVGTTQARVFGGGKSEKAFVDIFERLCRELRYKHGWRWRYRRPWLLLTGDDSAISRLLPGLAERGWLITQDAVLLWSKTGKDGCPDELLLKQLYTLRRRRPIDAIVLTIEGGANLPPECRTDSVYGVNLAGITDALYWAAPIFVLDVAQTDEVSNGNSQVFGCEFPPDADTGAIEAALMSLRDQLAHRSVKPLVANFRDRYGPELSERLDTRSAPLATWIAGLSERERRGHHHQRISGVYFAPLPVLHAAPLPGGRSSADLPVWRQLGLSARTEPGRRRNRHPITVGSFVALAVVGVWTAGMLVAGVFNGHDLIESQRAVDQLNTAPDAAARLRALVVLQREIGFYEDRIQHHVPLLTRFGLNHDREVLAALWKPYGQASRRDLLLPVQQNLEAELVDLRQMQTGQADAQTQLALEGHDTLKTYLMLADPSRVDAGFMTVQLQHQWRTQAKLSERERLDLSERLFKFYAQHLKAHPEWGIQTRPELVNGARQTLLALIGVRNSEDTIYQEVLSSVGNKYPNQTLMSLTAGTDPRGLMRTAASVPGVFTRQAYEGTIAAAIEDAAKRSDIASDWVLAPSAPQGGASIPIKPEGNPAALKAALTQRYFADYTDHWQGFMNALQWEPATDLPAAIEQLKLMADARQSPVIALMKSLKYQGEAGAIQDSLSDTLVAKAQTVFSRQTAPELAKADPAGPLGATFGPVLRLVAQGSGTDSDLSQQRYLDRVTSLRLKLQQISNSADADAQARQVAQALFQGKGSELADTQAYAQLIAASLGEQWAGMGDTLFVRPVAQALQTVLQPAQASLNEAWRQTIVTTWNRSFAGRYPFNPTDNDASLPELARFLRPQGGLISSFLSAQLAGVLELQGDRWVPAATGNQALVFDPEFLKAINTLQRISGHLLAQGEPEYRFEFKPIPTPGITDTLLTLDGQTLHYFNQRETWQALRWPANTPQEQGTRLEWQTEEAGTNKNFEFNGRWGLLRMLERARVEPVDDATYELTWQAAPDTEEPQTAQTAQTAQASVSDASVANAQQDNATANDTDNLNPHGPLTPASPDLAYPLSYTMRTEVGKGPLELLALRGFVLPTRIFMRKNADAALGAKRSARADIEDLPPVPKAVLDAVKRAQIPLRTVPSPL